MHASQLHVVKNAVLLYAVFDTASQVRSRRNGQILAMKCISKKMLARRNHISYMQAERDIMTKVRKSPGFRAPSLALLLNAHNARVFSQSAVLFFPVPLFFQRAFYL